MQNFGEMPKEFFPKKIFDSLRSQLLLKSTTTTTLTEICKELTKSTTLSTKLNSQRKYNRKVLESVMFLLRQRIPLRGSEKFLESVPSIEKIKRTNENIYALLQYRRLFDGNLKHGMSTCA